MSQLLKQYPVRTTIGSMIIFATIISSGSMVYARLVDDTASNKRATISNQKRILVNEKMHQESAVAFGQINTKLDYMVEKLSKF